MDKTVRNIEVLVARCDPNCHPYWAGDPESIGFFSKEEIDNDLEKKYGGPGTYYYRYPESD